MAWGMYTELYLLKKKSENYAGDTLASVGVRGEAWKREEVEKVISDLEVFINQAKEALKKNPNDICIRTNI